jgi:hypothetical protein
MEASSVIKNTVKMFMVIHAFLFAWHVTGSFFVFLKRGFNDFPVTIVTCLLPSSLFMHSSAFVLSGSFSPVPGLAFQHQYCSWGAVAEEAHLICIVNVPWLISF